MRASLTRSGGSHTGDVYLSVVLDAEEAAAFAAPASDPFKVHGEILVRDDGQVEIRKARPGRGSKVRKGRNNTYAEMFYRAGHLSGVRRQSVMIRDIDAANIQPGLIQFKLPGMFRGPPDKPALHDPARPAAVEEARAVVERQLGPDAFANVDKPQKLLGDLIKKTREINGLLEAVRKNTNARFAVNEAGTTLMLHVEYK